MPLFTSFGHIDDFLTIFLALAVVVILLYFALAGAAYYVFFVWKKEKYFPGKVVDRREIYKAIRLALWSIVANALLTAPFLLLIVKGYTPVYFTVAEWGWGYLLFSALALLAFAETWAYWMHRLLHRPFFYRTLHGYHHEFRDANPWVSLAFHPLDAFSQGLPFHLFVLVVPTYLGVHVALLVYVTLWTFMIHDQLTFFPIPGVNYTAHHNLHHKYNKYNYGQFFTFWDRVARTYRPPEPAKPEAVKVKRSRDRLISVTQ
jgi:lathosterol oxidase